MLTPNQKEIEQSKTSISFQNSSPITRQQHTRDKANVLSIHRFKKKTTDLLDICIRKADGGLSSTQFPTFLQVYASIFKTNDQLTSFAHKRLALFTISSRKHFLSNSYVLSFKD